ncbi:MAG: peptidase S8, partial [Chloroflexota bacterium]
MKIFRWWIIVTFVIFVLSGVGPQPAGSAALWQSKVDPALLSMAPGEPVEFIILLNQQASLHEAGLLTGKLEKTTFVAETLQETAARTQQPILARLASAGIEHRPYWIANMIWVRGDRSIIQSMAQRADVAHISANPQVRSDLPAPVSGASAPDAPGTALNIARVGAPQAWAAGFTGQGVVVAGQDTGYDWDHPALISQYRGWDGANADHNYNWHDAIHTSNGTCGADSQEPCDDQGHGTHTMGTIVGDDHQGNQIGMAPGARWIGCRNMNHGVGTPTTYAECFQWFMAPTDLEGNNPDPALAPDVINNSWGCPPSEGCDAANIQMLQGVVEAVRAAGILVVASAGNFGPACSTVKDPPGIYDASFSVGAVDNSDVAAGFSSRGGVGP